MIDDDLRVLADWALRVGAIRVAPGVYVAADGTRDFTRLANCTITGTRNGLVKVKLNYDPGENPMPPDTAAATYRVWQDQLALYRRLMRLDSLNATPRIDNMADALVPPHNPHRRDTYAAELRAGNFHPGLTIEDLHVLLEDRERRGYSAGYSEREERAFRQLEQCYDSAWAQGATAQHDATTNALGARVHVLAELARLVVPAALSRQGAEQAEVAYTLCDAIAGALDTLIEEHDAGPYRAPRDPRPSPTPLTPDEVASLGVQAPEPDEHARALELRDWLLEAVRCASADPAPTCPTCADEGDGSA